MKYYKPNNSTILYLNSSFNCVKSSSITVSIDNGGSGYISTPTLTLTSPVNEVGYGATVSANLTDGVITSLNITNGSNYNTVPTLTITGGGNVGVITGYSGLGGGSSYTLPPILSVSNGGGSGFEGYSVLTGTTISSTFTINNGGTGYSDYDIITFSGGGGGTGAEAIVSGIGSNGAITAITLMNVGSNYTLPPIVSISSISGNGADITVRLNPTTVASIVITNGGKNYSSTPTITFTAVSGTGGSGANCTATINLGKEAVLTPSFYKVSDFSWNIPDIVLNDLGKLSLINLVSTNFTASTPYSVRVKNLLYDSRDTYFSDYNYPILGIVQGTNVCSGQGSVSKADYSISLPSQIINKLSIGIDDSITTINSGLLSTINFVLVLLLEEYDPVLTEIGNPYQEAQRNQGFIHPRLV